MMWCGKYYKREEYDNFQIYNTEDEYWNFQYDCDYDKHRYKGGIEGAQLIKCF